MKDRKNYIDGKWMDALSGQKIPTVNPATGETICLVANGGRDDAKLAIEAAKKSFYETREWRDMESIQRAATLNKIADKIIERKDELALAETIDQGKPLRESEIDVEDTAACFRYYAGLIGKPSGEVFEVPKGFGDVLAYTRTEPVGVVAAVCPWNYPMLFVSWKMAPALAAGCSVVLKPASLTPLSTCIIFEILDEIGMPPGSVNLVMGSGSTVGQELAESMDVDMLSFTGSTDVGKEIMAASAKSNLKKVGLELGGKSPNIVFEDADLEIAVDWVIQGIFFCMGEVCAAGSRLLVQESISEKFLAMLKEKVERMTIGNGRENYDIGAIVSETQLNTVLNYIEKAKAEGAKVLCGGERYTEGPCAAGYFVKPTVFVECKPDMKIVQEEVFGPVLAVLTFKDEKEAIAIANDSVYGLAGGIFTTDIGRALRVSNELRVGCNWINCYHIYSNEGPWGGYRMSGIGREQGIYALQEYTEVKQVLIKLKPEAPGWFTN